MIYVVTTFLSAFLLFMVQPMMGKLLLPWFGGAAAVWTTCMLFFQAALLLGYGYAHALSSWLKPKMQARVHAGLLLLCGALMVWMQISRGSPVLPDDAWKPVGTEEPVSAILWLLLVNIGLPYVLLAATSPLLQRWFSLAGVQRASARTVPLTPALSPQVTREEQGEVSSGERLGEGKMEDSSAAGHGERTYRLYAVSNAGSLLGLLGYPLVTERYLPLPAQANVWAVVFVLFAVACMVCALKIRHEASVEVVEEKDEKRPEALTLLFWLLLAMSTSAMLLAVTNQLCQEVAAVPFLWVMPLAVYLVTFIICFDRPQWYVRRWFAPVTVIMTLVVLVTAFWGLRLKIPAHAAASGAFLFCFYMTCHGELVQLRPGGRHLTLFYLMIALGGALGGVFVGIAAPLLFTSYWEFNIMTTLSWVVLAAVFARDKESFLFKGDRLHFHLLAFLLAYTALRVVISSLSGLPAWAHGLDVSLLAAVVLTALLGWLLRRVAFPASKYWPRIVVGTVIFFAECFMVVRINVSGQNTLAADRNFFGTLRVQVWPGDGKTVPPFVQLTHGQINHGLQFTDDKLRRQPTSYYGPMSGVALAVSRHPRRLAGLPLRIGVLGLGTGTMAAHAQKGDAVRFYEINPLVTGYMRRAEPLFSYLKDCAGEVTIAKGDARLLLERELAAGEAQKLDLLVMDAFSSDSVPVHLLTREAFALYQRHLRDADSILAVNISNRFLDFRDLMATTAAEMKHTALLAEVLQVGPLTSPSSWVLLTRSTTFPNDMEVRKRSHILPQRQPVVWTDTFSNLLHLLR